ncbi:MAG: flavin monoamine oxidase family protein [Sphingomicrobium sp.]
MSVTRRDILMRVGSAAGAGATLAAMQMLGLTAATPASAADFALPNGSGAGRSVVILGAGIAGLISAYELRKAGYRVTVIEARKRVGGRAWTIRGNDIVEQIDRPPQQASLGAGLYFNAGPARLPSTHRAVLGYARRFGVPLETFVNSSHAAGWDFNGKVIRGRQMMENLNGRIGELLSKSIRSHALDAEMPKEELDQFTRFLSAYAGLNREGKLMPQSGSGFSRWPGGYDTPGIPLDPLTLRELLPSRAVRLPYIFQSIIDMQPTMLQPVGGMDRIATAIYEQVKPSVRLGQPITAIRRTASGVRVEHGGSATTADYCICTIPAPVLARIPSDFSAAKKAAIAKVRYLPSAKVAFEAPRFWEDEGIYGGLAWTDRLNENVIYPSNGYHGPSGVLVGAYVAGWNHNDTPEAFVKLPISEQIRITRESVEALHPGKSQLLGNPLVVNWGQVPYSEGVGAVGPDWGDEKRGALYDEMLKPEGPILFAGEHLSYIGLWQEGAALSAHEALQVLSAMAGERRTAGAS